MSEHTKRCGCSDPGHALGWSNWKLVQAEERIRTLEAEVVRLRGEREQARREEREDGRGEG